MQSRKPEKLYRRAEFEGYLQAPCRIRDKNYPKSIWKPSSRELQKETDPKSHCRSNCLGCLIWVPKLGPKLDPKCHCDPWVPISVEEMKAFCSFVRALFDDPKYQLHMLISLLSQRLNHFTIDSIVAYFGKIDSESRHILTPEKKKLSFLPANEDICSIRFPMLSHSSRPQEESHRGLQLRRCCYQECLHPSPARGRQLRALVARMLQCMRNSSEEISQVPQPKFWRIEIPHILPGADCRCKSHPSH